MLCARLSLAVYADFVDFVDLFICFLLIFCSHKGIPGCSWRGNQAVSEEGRAMAARLLTQLTDKQINDVFTASRANMMRNDTITGWVDGFKSKLQSALVDTKCPSTVV